MRQPATNPKVPSSFKGSGSFEWQAVPDPEAVSVGGWNLFLARIVLCAPDARGHATCWQDCGNCKLMVPPETAACSFTFARLCDRKAKSNATTGIRLSRPCPSISHTRSV